MNELTVKQIKVKQDQLKNDLIDLLNKFEQETGVNVTGEINYGYTYQKLQHWLSLKFSNPFME